MSEFDDTREIPEREDLNLLDIWLIVLKRKWLIAAITMAIILIVGAYTFTRIPIYTAKGQLLIEKEPNILTFQELFQVESFQTDYYQTQYKLLQSRSLALKAVEKLKLFENAEFTGKLETNIKKLGKDDSVFRSRLSDAFLESLTISPVRQTRLVDVTFKSADPNLAAAGVNALFDSFIEMSIETRFSATEQAAEFLTKQIASLSVEIERKERQLQQYGADKNIVTLSDKETTIIGKLADLNSALTQAQIERVNKEATYNEIKNATPDYIPEGIKNPLIQNLRGEYARLSREYAKKQDQFGPEYPEMRRLKAELESAKSVLENETSNLIKAAYSDFQGALKREQSMQAVFNAQKQESIQLNSNAISYNTLRNEIQNNRSLLDTLVKRQSETDVTARLKGVGVSNIKIVDRADVPQRPSSPRKKANLLLALIVGLICGLGSAFFLDYLDNSVKGAEDVEKYSRLPTLGFVPEFNAENYKKGDGYNIKYGGVKKKKELGPQKEVRKDPGRTIVETIPEVRSIDLITENARKSSFSECYRSIRTALLLSSADPNAKAFAISSPLPSEGKSSTIANLGIALAQAGKGVLILDADLRRSRQHKIFKTKNSNGLTNYLTGTADIKELVKSTSIQNLFLINAGPLPPNPAELLGSEKMAELIVELKKAFDIVLIDTPPILAVTDSLILGSKIDGLILVVWDGNTSREALKRARERLDLTKVKALGVILNRVDLKEHNSYYKHHYYQYYGEK